MVDVLVWSCPEPREGTRAELLSTNQGPTPALARTLSTGEITPTTNGYRSRIAYVNPASTELGSEFAGVECIAAIAGWFTEDDIPPGDEITFECFAASGGAVGGEAYIGGSSFNGYGAPGGAGGYEKWTYFRADVVAALPVLFTVGLKGTSTGGATAAVVGSVGAEGFPIGVPTDGGDCLAGDLCQAFGGKAGQNRGTSTGTSQAGVGGGQGGKGSGSNGGPPGAFTAGGNPGVGGGGVAATAGSPASSTYLGGAAGSSPGVPGSPLPKGGTGQRGGSGGGPGAAHNIAGSAAANGGDGGGPEGGLGGTSVVSSAAGGFLQAGDGGNGKRGRPGRAGQGGAGGGSAKFGGGSASTGARFANGGNGGNGGFPGGAPGGGGNGAASTPASGPPAGSANVTGGSGGIAADACLLITFK